MRMSQNRTLTPSELHSGGLAGKAETMRMRVLVMPGERVKIIKPFEDFKGLFMYHCHNLEHEDMGMMRDFLVE
jgi:FtsP/CotA-like multicopper oxidase with cupredoxin domain